MSDKKVIFIHIPKAGGNTLHSVLIRHFDRDKYYHIHQYGVSFKENVLKFKGLPDNVKEKYNYIRGHMGYGLDYDFNNFSVDYITMLREPVSRVVSNYYYILNNRRDMAVYDKIKNISLLEYVEKYNINNLQTRLLASNNGLPIDNKTLERGDLFNAIKNLNNINFIGLIEKFDYSLLLLKEKYGLTNIQYVSKNKTHEKTKKKEVSEKVKSRIAELNKFDIQLYKLAEEIFNKQLKDYPGNIIEDYELFQKNQVLYRNQYIRDYSDKGKEKIDYINELVNNLEGNNVAIYGAGEHTIRLLEDTDLSNKKIKFIIDSYKRGTDFYGFRVISPEDIKDYDIKVVILSSFNFQEEMYAKLRNKVNYKGKIIKIYNQNDEIPFYA